MSKKIKDTDYLFISSYLRACETKLLTHEDIERMITAKTYEDAAKVLEEHGYGSADTLSGAGALEQALAGRRADIMKDVSFLAPDKAVVDIFRIKYDYHNAKALIKTEARGLDVSELAIMSDCGRMSAAAFREACLQDDLKRLPPVLAGAVRGAREILARTGDPQMSDLSLDRAYFKELSALAEGTGSAFLTGYAKLSIDSANLRSAVRSARMGRDAAFMRQVLVPGGNIRPERIVVAATSGSPLAPVFSTSLLSKAAVAGDEAVSGGRLTEFEKLCDNALTAYLYEAKIASFSEKVVGGFVCAVENEISTVRIIMAGRLAGLPADDIRERLRESYA